MDTTNIKNILMDARQYTLAIETALTGDLEAFYKVSGVGQSGNDVLKHAVHLNDIDGARAVLNILPKARFDEAFLLACQQAHDPMLDVFFEAGMWMDQVVGAVVRSGNIEAVKWLAQKNIGHLPSNMLSTACHAQRSDMLELLLPAWPKDTDMSELLAYAAWTQGKARTQNVSLILEHFPNTNCELALDRSIFRGDIEVVRILLAAGDRFERQDNPTDYMQALDLTFDFSSPDNTIIMKAIFEKIDHSQLYEGVMKNAARSMLDAAVDVLYPCYSIEQIEDILQSIQLPHCYLARKHAMEMERLVLQKAVEHRTDMPAKRHSKI